MLRTPHELSEEFPAHIGMMRSLNLDNTHFANLFNEYHAINDAVHRSETNVEPTDELTEQTLRKERMLLKNEIRGMLLAG